MPRNLVRLLLRAVWLLLCVTLLTGATFVVSRYVSNRRLMTLCKPDNTGDLDIVLGGWIGPSTAWLDRWIGIDTAQALLCRPTTLILGERAEIIVDSDIRQMLQVSFGMDIICIFDRNLPEGSLELIATQHRAQRFDFRLSTIRPDDARWLSKMTQLKRVDIELFMREPCDNDWSWLKALPRLELLNVTMRDAGDQDVLAIAQIPALLHLILSGDSLSDDSISRLCDLPGLKSLNLEGRRIRLRFPGRQKLPSSLEILELRSTSIDDASLAAIAGLPELHTLSISGSGITDADMETLADLPSLYRLVLLDLPQLTDEGLKTLAQSASLTKVHIAGCGTTPTALVHLNALPNWEEIRFEDVWIERKPGAAKPILTPDNVAEYLSSQRQRQQVVREEFNGLP